MRQRESWTACIPNQVFAKWTKPLCNRICISLDCEYLVEFGTNNFCRFALPSPLSVDVIYLMAGHPSIYQSRRAKEKTILLNYLAKIVHDSRVRWGSHGLCVSKKGELSIRPWFLELNSNYLFIWAILYHSWLAASTSKVVRCNGTVAYNEGLEIHFPLLVQWKGS